MPRLAYHLSEKYSGLQTTIC